MVDMTDEIFEELQYYLRPILCVFFFFSKPIVTSLAFMYLTLTFSMHSPIQGDNITPSHFMLQKPELSANSFGPVWP